MNWFYNMKIAGKLILCFVLVAALAGVIGLVGYQSLQELTERDKATYAKHVVSLATVGDMGITFQRVRVTGRDAQAAANPQGFQKAADQLNTYRKLLDQLDESFEKSIVVADVRQTFQEYQEAKKTYFRELDVFMEFLKRGDAAAAKAYQDERIVPVAGKVGELIDKLGDLKQRNAEIATNQNAEQAATAARYMLITVLVAVALAIGLGLFLAKVIGDPVKKLVVAADGIAKGNLAAPDVAMTKDEIGQLVRSFGGMIDNINALVADANMLSAAAVAGKLDTRADASRHQGDYRRIVEGVNQTLDAVIGPLNVSAEYVDRISKGDIPPRITDNYNGDFNEIKNNLNQCIDAVNALVTDSNMLVQAAVAGKLATRADASRHQGDFRKIVEGVNQTLDAVVGPIREAAAVLKEMSQGNLQMRVKGDYQGDHAEIKNAMNETLDSLGAYIGELSSVLKEMANSNLNVGITGDYKGDFVQIKEAVNLIVSSFNEVFGEINNAADQVASGSKQVSDGSQALSQGAAEQASSIEELSVTIGQVATQTKDNALNANQANTLALSVKETAEEGNNHMKEMLKSMADINQSSASISKIIKVIDEIAFQTNILALNAAVEAARAGQHGKGFAVVAEEVRNLAARSANAAKETTALIEGSIKKAEDGTEIANGTAKALDEIVVGVTKAAALVGEIAEASSQQATSIAEVNKGIEQVSQVVQTNSATAEESAAASEELSSQAALLKGMVNKFRLKRNLFRDMDEEYAGLARYRQGNNPAPNALETIERVKPKISLGEREFGKY